MGTILSNGKSIYRYSGKILRTPIKIVLSPDSAGYYSVAGSYTTGTKLPATGFHGPLTQSDCYGVGYSCNSAYNSPTAELQIWRSTTASLEPETVFYQGTYATSAANAAASSEAYWQVGGYHFTIPDGLTVTAANIKYTLGGVVECYGNASAGSTHNAKGWPSLSVSTWYMTIGVIDEVMNKNMAYIAQNAAQQDVDILALTTASSGEAKGYRDVWGKLWDSTITGRDGAIPTLTTPSAQSLAADSNQIAAMNRLGGFWVVPFGNPTISSTTEYSPRYVPANVGYWGCASLWGISLELTLE